MILTSAQLCLLPRHCYARLAAAIGCAVLFGSSIATAAAQTVTVGKQTPAASQVTMDDIDHSDWDALLKQYVNEKGEVDYQSMKASRAATEQLDRYLNTLATASTTEPATRESRLAFWINAYNAVTVKAILREYPTTSIRNHTSRWGGYNIWKHFLLNVGDDKLSLDEIEHQRLRKMNEPRIHFAIVCASRGCPRLLNQAYTSNQLDAQLTANSKVFFANPLNFQFDVRTKTFKLSSIMKWFKEDFGANQRQQLKTIASFLPTQAAQDAAIADSVRVTYLDYDWNLNEQPTATRK